MTGAASPSASSESRFALDVEDVSVAFGATTVLDRLSFALEAGQIGCLLGASGCGKTTALRAIAGFVRPQHGSITIDGRAVCSSTAWREPEERGVGVVFQDYALFPHLSVADNVGFGLRRLPGTERRTRVQQMLALVGMAGNAQRYPHELSGGQQQRVALARALAPSPELLLLDEPFSNLDPDLRVRLAQEVRDILKERGTTALLVTHDQHEAFAMAERIGVLDNGRIEQWGSPYDLYHKPASPAVAEFVGEGVLLPGRLLRSGQEVEIELGRLSIESRHDRVTARASAGLRGEIMVLLRPDDVIHDDASTVLAEVRRRAFRGSHFLYTLKLPSGAEVLALAPSHHDHRIGSRIGIRLDTDHVVTFPVS